MRRLSIPLVLAAAACAAAPAESVAPGESSAAAPGPVVVELFQSQGCSSCPPANANLNRIADRTDVLALSFAVTYWDDLGWKDTFARAAFTERQRAYARSGGSDGVYTPQVVINGRRALVGASRAGFDAAIRAEGRLRGGPAIERQGDAVAIGPGAPGGTANVLIVTYDPRLRNVPVRAGENSGKTLPHRNIVVDLREAGRWTGKPVRVTFAPPADPALRSAVLIQRGEGGPIVAAAKL